MPKQQTAAARCGDRKASSTSSRVGDPDENGQTSLAEESAFACVGRTTAYQNLKRYRVSTEVEDCRAYLLGQEL